LGISAPLVEANWLSLVAIIIIAGVVALVGFIDDRQSVAIHIRLLTHFVAASLVVLYVIPIPKPDFIGNYFLVRLSVSLFFIIFIVWMINLYNFMDGIDGLATLQTIFVCFALVAIPVFSEKGDSFLLPLTLGAAACGFVAWNFPQAKIFMGDVGSGYIGFVISIIAIDLGSKDSSLLWVFLILMGIFVVDSTLTLVRRFFDGKTVYLPHRSHAYQHAVGRLGSHGRVTVAAQLVNFLWLFPIGMLVSLDYLNGALGLIIAYSPLVVIALKLDAGVGD
jgi:Fuc2NAc and GlcNAc transferase